MVSSLAQEVSCRLNERCNNVSSSYVHAVPLTANGSVGFPLPGGPFLPQCPYADPRFYRYAHSSTHQDSRGRGQASDRQASAGRKRVLCRRAHQKPELLTGRGHT